MEPYAYNLLTILALLGMILCLTYIIAEDTRGYEGRERLQFGWWFYIEGGREEVNKELDHIGIQLLNDSLKKDIARKLFEENT